MSTRIYLARHGETDWNLHLRLQGWSDTPLNERGEAQARALVSHLAEVSFDAVYCSSLARSRTTAAGLAERAPLHVRPRLRERGLGRFEGVCMDGSEPELATEFERRIRDPDDSLDGGESHWQHRARIEAVAGEIFAAHPEGALVIVGHGGTNGVITRFLLGDAAPRMHQPNDALDVIDLSAGGAELVEHIRYGAA